MKLSVALFFAGLFGALAVVFTLLSFGTDYWLLASESCPPTSDNERGAAEGNVTTGFALYHEGFFWRCSFAGDAQEEDLLWKLWFTNQAHSKVCTHAYLFPFPVSHHTHNATAYESAIIYRGFWSVFMLIGVAAAVLAGFFIICAAPFASHCLYKTGGGFFLASGLFLLCVVVMYVLWIEVLDVVDVYVNHQRSNVCPDFQLNLHYGLSFIFAPVGVFFSLLAGLLFFLIGRTIKIHYH
ncbi:transmembrane protein 182 [Syngnathoides biaculeatus]|uniref:transmembrane protein 182 n=1 Tax=Syngnathoides biaculeatus TaxID=300417 RepID=UPI002ADE129E|nr:transmembrane protein 182 [Syngnathoides biaculeatus]